MFTLEYILQQLINGLTLGCMYSLLALGLSTVYGLLRLINFAHGILITLGAFFSYICLMKFGIHFAIFIPLLMGFGAIMGVLLDTVAYRGLRGGPEVALLITSLGFYILLENLTKMIASPQPYAFKPPAYFQQLHHIGGVVFRTVDVFIIIFSFALMIAFSIFIKKAKMGIAIRATAENVEAARMIGIDVDKVIATVFILGSAIAAVTGFMWGAKYGQISYDMGFLAGVKAFIAVVIGGIGSITGAMIGGLLLGIIEIMSIALLPPGFAAYRDGIVFAILIIVLLIKPSGIMGKKEEVKV